jgi:hypothetical protein
VKTLNRKFAQPQYRTQFKKPQKGTLFLTEPCNCNSLPIPSGKGGALTLVAGVEGIQLVFGNVSFCSPKRNSLSPLVK